MMASCKNVLYFGKPILKLHWSPLKYVLPTLRYILCVHKCYCAVYFQFNPQFISPSLYQLTHRKWITICGLMTMRKFEMWLISTPLYLHRGTHIFKFIPPPRLRLQRICKSLYSKDGWPGRSRPKHQKFA